MAGRRKQEFGGAGRGSSHSCRANPRVQQSNVPAHPTHRAKYRLHLSPEELVEAISFSEPLRALMSARGPG